MARQSRDITVDDLIAQVRSQLDEENRSSVDDDEDILPALNRGMNYAASIYARHYEEPLLAYRTLDLVAGTAEYDIPENCFEDRIERVEIAINGSYTEVLRISYRDISMYETSSRGDTPRFYCVIGRSIRLVDTPSGAYDARIWYLRTPEPLLKEQGRIVTVNTAGNYLIVDELGGDLTTESDELASYINVVNSSTGEIRGSFQIQSISDTRVNLKTSPIRTTVQDRTISSASQLSTLEVGADDYICLVHGTCIPYYPNPTSNFLVQYAVSELSRKLDSGADLEERILDKFERQVERTWVGRESTIRVKSKSDKWKSPLIRYRYRSGRV